MESNGVLNKIAKWSSLFLYLKKLSSNGVLNKLQTSHMTLKHFNKNIYQNQGVSFRVLRSKTGFSYLFDMLTEPSHSGYMFMM